MHTPLLSAPTMVRLSPWEKSVKTFGVFDIPGSGWKGVSGRREVENSADSILNNPSALDASVPSMNEKKEFWGDEIRGWGQVKWRM